MTGTFISYRREDAAGYAGRLRESLERRLGPARVFRDVDTLRPGQDFVQAIESRLADCAVMLAVIGHDWVDARDLTGARRLDEPFDFVRLEIAAALARPNVLVVPVLVEGASMPAAAQLPEPIRNLARRQAVTVRDETWDADVDRLVTVIENASRADTGRADAPIAPARLWVAAALAVVIIGLLVYNERREDAGRTAGESGPAATGSPAAGTPGTAATSGAGTGATAGTSPGTAAAPIGAGYTIAIPRIAEAAFGDVIYSVVSGNLLPREPTNELRLRVRVMNAASYDVVFADGLFRLAVGGDVLTPTSDLRELVPGRSLRYGIVTFRVPPGTRAGTLQIVSDPNKADIPLDLTSTGRPPVDEQAEVADSLAQAVTMPVVRDPVPLLDANNLAITLLRAHTRRFANTLRLELSLRYANHGRYPSYTGAATLRISTGGELVAPFSIPSQTIDAMSTVSITADFDLPTATTKAALRTTIGDQTAERPLELK